MLFNVIFFIIYRIKNPIIFINDLYIEKLNFLIFVDFTIKD